MHRVVRFALPAAVAIACSAHAPKYPACQHDDQCAVGGKHDYCVAGRCAYCRTAVDCGDRQRCRAGACEPDPDAPPPPEAGADAGDEAGDEAGDDDEQTQLQPDPDASPYEVRLRELERRVRELRQEVRRQGRRD